MTSKQYVEYRDRGFWAYDIALGILLKHVIDIAEPLAATPDSEWLASAVSDWRVPAAISDYGLEIDKNWSATQLDVFVNLFHRACRSVDEREAIEAEEIESWTMLDGLHLSSRGAPKVFTAPVVELGRAIIALVEGTLPVAPSGTAWFYGVPQGRTTIGNAGLEASQLNSALTTSEQQENLEQIETESADFIFVTPERFTNQEFLADLRTKTIDFVVIDEAHCISEWGHDFRPPICPSGSLLRHSGHRRCWL